jgi:hypothetical protein
MAVKVNDRAVEHATRLINDRRYVSDDRDEWSEHQPSAQQEDDYIEAHGFDGYGRWYLGVDDERASDTKGHYTFPFGDFSAVHRCAVLSAESRAGQHKYFDIEHVAAHLHGMLDALR